MAIVLFIFSITSKVLKQLEFGIIRDVSRNDVSFSKVKEFQFYFGRYTF